MTFDELSEKTISWAREKGINDPKSQLNHIIEEVGEIATELNKNRANSKGMEDAIGDSLVTLLVFADILGYDPKDCLELAYNEIKGRTGEMVNGSFIKSADFRQ